MRAAWIVCLLFALSGCASPDPGAATDPNDSDGTPGAEGANGTSGPSTPVAGVNRAPTITLEAAETTIYVGATVVFNITVADPDGDNTTWIIDADGDGEADGSGDGATFSFAYAAAGNYLAKATASDGNLTGNATLAIQVVDLPPPGGTTFPVTYVQDVTLSCPHCFSSDGTGDVGCVGLVVEENGLDCAWFPLPADAVGHAFTISGTFFPLWQASATCNGEGIIDFGVAATGTIPAGAGCLFVWDPIDPLVTVTVKIV